MALVCNILLRIFTCVGLAILWYFDYSQRQNWINYIKISNKYFWKQSTLLTALLLDPPSETKRKFRVISHTDFLHLCNLIHLHSDAWVKYSQFDTEEDFFSLKWIFLSFKQNKEKYLYIYESNTGDSKRTFLFQNRNVHVGSLLKISDWRQSMEHLKVFWVIARVIVTSRRYRQMPLILKTLPQIKGSFCCVISEVKAVNRCTTCILQLIVHGAKQLSFSLGLVLAIAVEKGHFKTKIPGLSVKTDRQKIVLQLLAVFVLTTRAAHKNQNTHMVL